MAQCLLLNDDCRHDEEWLAEGAGQRWQDVGAVLVSHVSAAAQRSHPLQCEDERKRVEDAQLKLSILAMRFSDLKSLSWSRDRRMRGEERE